MDNPNLISRRVLRPSHDERLTVRSDVVSGDCHSTVEFALKQHNRLAQLQRRLLRRNLERHEVTRAASRKANP